MRAERHIQGFHLAESGTRNNRGPSRGPYFRTCLGNHGGPNLSTTFRIYPPPSEFTHPLRIYPSLQTQQKLTLAPAGLFGSNKDKFCDNWTLVRQNIRKTTCKRIPTLTPSRSVSECLFNNRKRRIFVYFIVLLTTFPAI